MSRFILGVAIACGALFMFLDRPETIQTAPAVVSYAPATLPDPTTTIAAPTTTQGPILPLVGPDTPCQEWVPEAIAAGWPADRQILETLMSIIWRESRCQPDAWNGHDAGLTQINQIHTAWIAELGLGNHPDAMFDPARNLEFAWKLYSSREAAGKCGWKPWSISC